MKSENNNLANSFATFIKDACQQTKDDIIEARKNGDIFAKDFVKPLKTNTGFDTLVEKKCFTNGSNDSRWCDTFNVSYEDCCKRIRN